MVIIFVVQADESSCQFLCFYFRASTVHFDSDAGSVLDSVG